MLSQVYSITDVVSESELKSISVQAFVSASSLAERKALLPERRSEWIHGHMKNFFSADRPGKLDKSSL